ncbi:hypothetical protein HPULCUR_001723 [Helicostylum pulchrum]|uniref:Uncharacterized protein n=1 Tax=Helicostylum pulchrum TaxID=562976 RepID=A0ABP9XPG4_9FUNG
MFRRRHTLSSISFIDPAIVRFIEKESSSSSSSSSCIMDEEDMDDQRTTITTHSLPQHLSYASHKHTSNLDTLWARQEKYDEMELRLLSLEVTKKRFEQRLQALEDNKPILLHPSMKPDQQPQNIRLHDDDDGDDEEAVVTNKQYLDLFNKHQLLLSKYNAIQIEFEEYKQKSTTNNSMMTEPEQHENEGYKEEDGYLIFDTTNMNGEIIQCKVKIPTPSITPPATSVGSPQYQTPPTPLPSRKGLNFNAPEWKTSL